MKIFEFKSNHRYAEVIYIFLQKLLQWKHLKITEKEQKKSS